MLTQSTIERFYKDLNSLGLKHPVAAIEKKTGIPKSQVSKVLSKKLQPSEKFLEKFYESFQIVSKETTVEKLPNGSNGDRYLKLLEDNDRFFKTEYAQLLISLNKLMDIGKKSEALIKLNLEHIGNVEAFQKGIPAEEIHEQINNQIVEMGPSE